MRLLPPRPLTPSDHLAGFSCGYPQLDDWLTDQAPRAERNGTARVYLVVDADTDAPAGYYCLCAHAVERATIGGGALARNTPPQVPAILLGRLAVDIRYQGRRLGTSLLHDAVLNATAVAARIGSRALIVDAIDDRAAQFYRRHGFRPFPTDPLRLFHRL